jgi:hypothetical protein
MEVGGTVASAADSSQALSPSNPLACLDIDPRQMLIEGGIAITAKVQSKPLARLTKTKCRVDDAIEDCATGVRSQLLHDLRPTLRATFKT